MQRSEILQWLTQSAYAHRGLHNAHVPENSLSAFRAALDAGLGIECDIRRSADGRAMVFHDETLERMTARTDPVIALTVGELTQITLGNTDETIPTLTDLLSAVAAKVPVLLELKTDTARPVAPLCRAVRRDLEGYQGQIAVMSFDHRVVEWFARKLPSLPHGLVVTEQGARTLLGRLKQRRIIRRSGAQFLAYDVRDLPSRIAVAAAARGLPLASWTVRNAAQLQVAREAGCAPIVEGEGVEAWRART